MANAEFEDCLSVDIYKKEIGEEFGIDLTKRSFRNNKKWSDRMRDTFLSQGKLWNDQIEQKVKHIVASCVIADPEKSLNAHKRSSIDALILGIETKLKKSST